MIITGQGVYEERESDEEMVVTEEGVHNLGVFVSAPHPLNGNVYFASCIKEPNGIKQHLVIHRLKLGSKTPEEVHRFLGGGGAGAYAKGQITPGNCQILPTGGIICSFSACPMDSKDNEWKSCTEIIPNKDAPWSYLGAAIQLTLPAHDETARALATQAKDLAQSAHAKVTQSVITLIQIQGIINIINTKLKTVPTMDQVWQKAIDATARPELWASIADKVQEGIVDAIVFAKNAPATKSRLRSLVEYIIDQKGK